MPFPSIPLNVYHCRGQAYKETAHSLILPVSQLQFFKFRSYMPFKNNNFEEQSEHITGRA